VASDGGRARVGTQGVPTGRRLPGLLFAPLREPFCSRGPGVLCFVFARATHALSWTRDCSVQGGRTPPLEKRRARARVGRSRVAYIGVCAVSAREG
jgi:hypothetical protein